MMFGVSTSYRGLNRRAFDDRGSMPSAFLQSSSDNNTSLTGRIVAIGSLLVAANVVVWTCALVVFHVHSVLLGTSLLAYGLGLWHSVDADNIAAIHNVTPPLMQAGTHPLAAGQ